MIDWVFFFFGGAVVGMLAAEVALRRKTGHGIEYYLTKFKREKMVTIK